MTDMETLYQVVDELTPEEQERLLDYLQQARQVKKVPLKKRIFDMHPDAITLSDDFDDELPDSFWFGEE
jgi:hypothetical protein